MHKNLSKLYKFGASFNHWLSIHIFISQLNKPPQFHVFIKAPQFQRHNQSTVDLLYVYTARIELHIVYSEQKNPLEARKFDTTLNY